jgi:CelD/BcsL family acetyltransferase involved in cellulose biosynthesis
MTDALDIDLIAPAELDDGLTTAWEGMLAANPALTSPYFTAQFSKVAGAVTPGARIAVLHRGGRPVGFFPHQSRSGAIQPLAAPMNDYHGVIAAPEDVPSLEAMADLMGARRLAVGGWIGPASGGRHGSTVQAAMPDGYDAWYAERRLTFGKYFKDKERARRSLEAELGPIRMEFARRDHALIDRVIDLKREQYRRTGRHDVFACGWTRDVLHALAASGDARFGASVSALWGGDRLAAIEISLHATDQWHFWFPAYDPAAARCSPGILLSLDTMKAAAAEGWTVFDYGFQGEGYKKYFCNAQIDVIEATVERPGPVRAALSAASAALGLAGQARAQRLRDSVRRRWAAIEACEVTPGARMRGAVAAAGSAFSKLSASPART